MCYISMSTKSLFSVRVNALAVSDQRLRVMTLVGTQSALHLRQLATLHLEVREQSAFHRVPLGTVRTLERLADQSATAEVEAAVGRRESCNRGGTDIRGSVVIVNWIL
jgi:hypothetical protein